MNLSCRWFSVVFRGFQAVAWSTGTISKTRGERLRHSGLTSEALFDELWQKRDVIAA